MNKYLPFFILAILLAPAPFVSADDASDMMDAALAEQAQSPNDQNAIARVATSAASVPEKSAPPLD